jgi:sugar/nucleoside kinase (ribokinase family)
MPKGFAQAARLENRIAARSLREPRAFPGMESPERNEFVQF